MFERLFGRQRPANDGSHPAPIVVDLDTAIEHCVKPEGQGMVRGIFLTAEGGDCLDRGDYVGAVQRFEAALAEAPDGCFAGNAHVMLGIAHHQFGRYDLAREAFTRAIGFNCTSMNEAYRRRSFVQAALGDLNAALADMRRAAAEGEDPAFVAAKLCALHLAIGDPKAALAAVLETAATQEGSVQYRLEQMQSRAEVRLLLGDRLGVLADLELEAELAPGDDAGMALWRYTLRRRVGLDGVTPSIEMQTATSEDPSASYFLIWFETGDVAARDQTLAWIEGWPATDDRMTTLCESHYRLGAVAECAGDREAARHHYTFATAHPEAAWCIEYALAQYGLRRVDDVPADQR